MIIWARAIWEKGSPRFEIARASLATMSPRCILLLKQFAIMSALTHVRPIAWSCNNVLHCLHVHGAKEQRNDE